MPTVVSTFEGAGRGASTLALRRLSAPTSISRSRDRTGRAAATRDSRWHCKAPARFGEDHEDTGAAGGQPPALLSVAGDEARTRDPYPWQDDQAVEVVCEYGCSQPDGRDWSTEPHWVPWKAKLVCVPDAPTESAGETGNGTNLAQRVAMADRTGWSPVGTRTSDVSGR